jgi:hypothetical protein
MLPDEVLTRIAQYLSGPLAQLSLQHTQSPWFEFQDHEKACSSIYAFIEKVGATHYNYGPLERVLLTVFIRLSEEDNLIATMTPEKWFELRLRKHPSAQKQEPRVLLFGRRTWLTPRERHFLKELLSRFLASPDCNLFPCPLRRGTIPAECEVIARSTVQINCSQLEWKLLPWGVDGASFAQAWGLRGSSKKE